MSCIEHLVYAINVTQSCANNHKFYVPTEGIGSGLGSEFNFWLIYAVINAIIERRRFVFIKTGRIWEFDCPSKSGWACYLRFSCPDSVIESHDMDLSGLNSAGMNFYNKISDRDNHIRDLDQIYRSIENIYFDYHENQMKKCPHQDLNPTSLTTIVAKHLYRLNDHTKKFTNHFNSRYNLKNKSYLALHLRSGDKKYEVSAEIWNWIHNMSNVYGVMKPYLQTIPRVFVSTDNCTIINDILHTFPKHIEISCPCLKDSSSIGDIDADLVGDFNPRRGTYRSTLRLFADIEMLMNGEHFFGLTKSNFVRMIMRIRPFDMNSSHALAEELTNADINVRLDHLTN